MKALTKEEILIRLEALSKHRQYLVDEYEYERHELEININRAISRTEELITFYQDSLCELKGEQHD